MIFDVICDLLPKAGKSCRSWKWFLGCRLQNRQDPAPRPRTKLVQTAKGAGVTPGFGRAAADFGVARIRPTLENV